MGPQSPSLLTIEEIEGLLESADRYGRHRVRNRRMVLLGFRHGLRREEISLLRWDAIDWLNGQISIQRVKGLESGIHPFQAHEVAGLRYSCGYTRLNPDRFKVIRWG